MGEGGSAPEGASQKKGFLKRLFRRENKTASPREVFKKIDAEHGNVVGGGFAERVSGIDENNNRAAGRIHQTIQKGAEAVDQIHTQVTHGLPHLPPLGDPTAVEDQLAELKKNVRK